MEHGRLDRLRSVAKLLRGEASLHHPSSDAQDTDPSVPNVRIGIDFGTSTIQVAYRIGDSEPRILRLEDLSNHMPSYFAVGRDGGYLFGSEANNAAESFHSIKLRLAADEPIAELDGMLPSQVAFLMLQEVVRRTLLQLKGLRVLPASALVLEVATNLGCTPRFDLDQRVRLRDVARKAGLDVKLADLIEEPVAAAFELVRAAAAPEGALLIIDVGGGTADIAVVRSDLGRERVDIYATSGHELGGDNYTDKVAALITEAVAERTGATKLHRRDETLIWQRAEAAKVTLSSQESSVVPLGGIAGLGPEDLLIGREWLDAATLGLREETRRRVLNTYRVARLVLDRGGPDDPGPGTIYVRETKPGAFTRITELWLDDDAVSHLAGVVLVGGASRDPKLRSRFAGDFGDKLIDPTDLGVDPVEAIALGLARGDSITTANRLFPNWGVSAVFFGSSGEIEIPLYEPFYPAFHVRDGTTAVYERTLSVPDPTTTGVALAFRPIGGDATGRRWPAKAVSATSGILTFEMDLFGRVSFTTAGGMNLVPPEALAPWAPREAGRLASWIPPSTRQVTYEDPAGWRDDTR